MNDERPPVPPENRFDPWSSRQRENPHSPVHDFDEAMWNAREKAIPKGEAETDEYEERKKFFTDLGNTEEGT